MGAYQSRNRARYSAIAEFFDLAIKSYEAKLSAHPQKRAQTKPNFDLFYSARAEALGLAIKAYEAALTVLTREAFPRDHLMTARLLGEAQLNKQDWRNADKAFAGAREAFSVLFGQGLHEEEARYLIEQAGPLFAEAAFAATQMGPRTERALDLSERRQGAADGGGTAPAIA